MSGHNKWSTIKRKKEKTDAARGKMFTKYIREIMIAARLGGGDPETNNRLRVAIQGAKAVNMPNENIKRAIQKATGEGGGVTYEEVIYEGYGPGGAAIYIYGTTDNKNRTAADIRHVFGKHGGNLGDSGCVSWMFEPKGLITVNTEQYDEDTVMAAAIDAGADDMQTADDLYEIYCSVDAIENVKKGLETAKIHVNTAEMTRIPQSTIKLDEKDQERVLKLLDRLDELDDVSDVYNNVDW
ncbi:MAG: YebC/PmpR family DNA-binding transcriptional regulator [Candidatus Coatesbacteria bacterium]|nr:YebC/PmpR family DNA-binding transcriptional regulator [Candidatus Coatesbacteria bacterium]